MRLSLIVNGVRHDITTSGEATLLEVLREDLGSTAPKLGCGEGVCGACTVLLGGRAVQTCQIRAADADGGRVTTAEGLAEDGLLHPVQQAWLETGAMQCGYCTPGWMCGTAGLLARLPHPSDERIAAELAVHACRCCAYPRIRRAIQRAAALLEDPQEAEVGPAAGTQPGGPVPATPWDLSDKQPATFAADMAEGLLAVVASDDKPDPAPGRPPGWGAPDEAWLHVSPDGAVTGYAGKVEAGQGTRTALALLVAEELSVAPEQVTIALGDTASSPFDMGTFGSRSMPHAAPPLRAAAAGARELLIQEASARLGMPPDWLTAANGMIAGPDGAPSVGYGALVAGRRRVERIPADRRVTPAATWRVAGHRARAQNAMAAVTGAKRFPSDLRLPGMLHGAVLRPPAHGAALVEADTAAAHEGEGVTVVRDGDFIGVAAPTRAAADAAVARITATWRQPPPEPDAAALAEYLRAHPQPDEGWGASFSSSEGDVETALGQGTDRIHATYTTAYIAHAPLETRSALAALEDGRLTVWTATSTPFRARRELAAALGLPEADVRVVVPDYGGGFGGRHGGAVALEAARLARAANAPVRVHWSREEEFRQGYLRPAAVIDIESSLDERRQILGWSHLNINSGPFGLQPPYRIPNVRVRYQPAQSPLPQGSYRALAATANNFARESHIDELAAAAHADPVEFRLAHLDDERLSAVLRAAADGVGWAGSPGGTVGDGVALGMEKGGRVATAARVRVDTDGTLTVLQLVTAFDCGAIVNPDGLENQVEGAVMMGLGAALFEAIDFAGGRIRNASLAGYRIPRLSDLPDVRVILLDQPAEPSAGGGEAPIIAVAPAIANAIARACGTRRRAMPLAPSGRVPLTRDGGPAG